MIFELIQDFSDTLSSSPTRLGQRQILSLLLDLAKRFGIDEPKSPHWDKIADLFTDMQFLETKGKAAE